MLLLIPRLGLTPSGGFALAFGPLEREPHRLPVFGFLYHGATAISDLRPPLGEVDLGLARDGIGTPRSRSVKS